MPRQQRRNTYSGKQFIAVVALTMVAVYAFCQVNGSMNGQTMEAKAVRSGEMYAQDPFTYGTAVSPAWEKSRVAIAASHRVREAAREGSVEEVRRMISQGISVDKDLGQRQTLLMLACERGQLKLARYLVSLHANVDAADNSGNTPRSLAAANGHAAVVRFLENTGSSRQLAHRAPANRPIGVSSRRSLPTASRTPCAGCAVGLPDAAHGRISL
jgi:hypothetical protein